LIPAEQLAQCTANVSLIPLLTEWRRRELPIHAVYPHRLLLSAKIRTFVDLLAERLGGDRDCDQGRHQSDTSAPSIKHRMTP
jgi:DNA-binding transcriptional LysR family regulator